MAASEKPWYSRPVFFVKDVEGALAFYKERLAFSESWRHEEEGAVLVAQVERSGFEIILNHSTDRAGKSRAFMSLDRGQVREAMGDFESRGALGFVRRRLRRYRRAPTVSPPNHRGRSPRLPRSPGPH